MKTTTFKNKIFNTALLGATCAITLCAQQAFAFGMMGGAVGAYVGGIGSGRPESSASRAGAANEAGSVTMNGITVMGPLQNERLCGLLAQRSEQRTELHFRKWIKHGTGDATDQ